jgi:signal transduction histidine kinase/CheY-like chemotaxis protein
LQGGLKFTYICQPLSKNRMNDIPKQGINILNRWKAELPDSLDQVMFILFTASVFISLLKLFIAFPHYHDKPIVLSVVMMGIIVSVLLMLFLLLRPKKLILLTKIGLIWMAAYVFLVIYFSPDRMNFVSIQHMFIVIMLAFYGINRFWGIAFSIFFVVIVMIYLVGVKNGDYEISIYPGSFPFHSSFAIVFLNFVQIVFIHYMYNRTLTNTVRDIRRLNTQLEDLVKAKSDFLSTMSHELRTPLNSVIGTAYLLIESDMDESQRNNIRNLRFSAESLLVLINDILDYSKMDSKHIQLESIPFYPTEIVENVFEGLKSKADEKNLRMCLDISELDRNTKVNGDPARLTQIVYNMLGNAIKFTSVGKVAVFVKFNRMSESDAVCVIEVEDTGIGIDEEIQNNIFEPFTQASSSINREFGGTGLGLAIVKHLVQLHKGNISLKSKVGFGTTFKIELPYKYYTRNLPAEKEVKQPQKLIQNKDFSQIKLLLAEDNQMSVLFMKQLLARWKISPEIAFDGQEVIDIVQGGASFDVILMDIHMPKVNGLEAVSFIRKMEAERGGHSYIIALTASVSDKIISELSDFGFDDYLGKPFNPNDLQHKLENAMKQ